MRLQYILQCQNPVALVEFAVTTDDAALVEAILVAAKHDFREAVSLKIVVDGTDAVGRDHEETIAVARGLIHRSNTTTITNKENDDECRIGKADEQAC